MYCYFLLDVYVDCGDFVFGEWLMYLDFVLIFYLIVVYVEWVEYVDEDLFYLVYVGDYVDGFV